MLIRHEVSYIWGSGELPRKIRIFYSRCLPYLQRGPGHFLMYVFGRFGLVRSFMVSVYRQGRPKAMSSSDISLIEDVDVDTAVASIHRDGFFCGLKLRQEVVEELLTSSSLATCFGDGKVDSPFFYGTLHTSQQQNAKKFRLGSYNNALGRFPALRSLTSDPGLLAIARRYLGTEPALIGARMWWSFVGPADEVQQVKAGQGFHYDIDGYRGLTFFFYLTDVTPSGGPHIYVCGSHVRKSWRHLLSISKARSDHEIEQTYGPKALVMLCGGPGSGFAEDIFGFHKGLHPEKSNRLIVQIRYGLHSYGEPTD